MWIKELKEIEPSNSCHLNFLWKDDKRQIFIMDNHLAALWCWLNNLSFEEKYTLFHLDFHWDSLDMASEYIEDLKKINQASLKEFLSVKNDDGFPIVQWDNYMHPLILLRPNLCEAFLTASEKIDCGDIFSIENINAYEVVEEFFFGLNQNLKNAKGKILFNLDLDFFFWSFDNKKVQAFSIDFIKELSNEIKPYLNQRTILTIALSPECCDGWQNSIKICEIFCNFLDINFPLRQIEELLK